MPILVILLLVAAVLPVEWPGPAFALSPRGTLLITACLALGLAGAGAVVSGAVGRSVARNPDRRAVVAKRYYRWRQFAFFLNIGITLVSLFALGWGRVIREHVVIPWHGRPTLAPFAELLVPAPYLAVMALNWAVYWPAERAFHRAKRTDLPFWSLPAFWLYQARQFVIVALPVLLCTTHQTLTRYFPMTTAGWWYQAAVPAGAVGLAVLLPRLMKPLLGLKRLPDGPIRDRLEATAARLGVRYTDLLLWPTRGAMANAMVIGVIPQARYVIFTDRLLDGLDDDEVVAVFGHELGHARHSHLPYYLLFFLLSSAAMGAGAVLAVKGLETSGWTPAVFSWGDLFVLPPVAAMGAYVFLVFGWLSRVCERQADVFGSRAGSCGNPACEGHDQDTRLADRGRGWCPTGARVMARALERVMVLNGWEPDGRDETTRWRLFRRLSGWVRAWQHGPMPARVNYLMRAADAPALADAHDRRAFRVRVFLVAVLIGVVAAGVLLAGDELFQVM